MIHTNSIDYVTSEIQGPPEERKKTLKKGALIAISVVNILYILFNLFVVSHSIGSGIAIF